MQIASLTGTLSGIIEQRLGEESGAPSALLLPIPADGGDGGGREILIANLKSDIAVAKGRPVLLKSTSEGWAERESAAAPQRDWQANQTRGESSRVHDLPPTGFRSLGPQCLSGPGSSIRRCRWNEPERVLEAIRHGDLRTPLPADGRGTFTEAGSSRVWTSHSDPSGHPI